MKSHIGETLSKAFESIRAIRRAHVATREKHRDRLDSLARRVESLEKSVRKLENQVSGHVLE